VITRKGSVLLDRFPLRVIVNGSAIYELQKGQQLAIALPANYPHIAVTNGFHYMEPLQIKYNHKRTLYIAITCTIDNDKLLAGCILTTLFFLAGLTSGIVFIRVISFLPILYFLYAYYLNRNSFIQLRSLSLVQ
jgi:hypothetical protein